jgi:hypothetical protein
MGMLSVYEGTEIQLVGTFANLAGTLSDPTASTFYVQPPTGTETAIVGTLSSTGIYYTNVNTTGYEAGIYTYRLQGTGSLVATEEERFEVKASEVR